MCNENGTYSMNRSDTKRIIHFRRGDIYFCNLDENTPGEKTCFSTSGLIGKTRPCVIWSCQEYNDEFRNTYMVIPIKTNNTDDPIDEYIKRSPDVFVPIWMEGTEKMIMINQLRPIAPQNIKAYSGTIVNQDVINEIDRKIWELFYQKKTNDIFDNYKDMDNIIEFLRSDKALTCYKHWKKEKEIKK